MTDNELTIRLIGRDFGLDKTKPKCWKSLKTGKEYSYKDYCNHGKGGEYKGWLDLPKDEYPYTIIFV